MDAVSTRNLTKTYQARSHSGSLALSLEATVARWLALTFTEILFIVLTAVIAEMARIFDMEFACALEPER